MVDLNKLNEMCEWERKKAIFLLQTAEELGMDTSCYGELAVNQTSGYTYLWLEDYNFTLYFPITCELDKSDMYALHYNSENGNETETEVGNKTLAQLETWADMLENKNI